MMEKMREQGLGAMVGEKTRDQTPSSSDSPTCTSSNKSSICAHETPDLGKDIISFLAFTKGAQEKKKRENKKEQAFTITTTILLFITIISSIGRSIQSPKSQIQRKMERSWVIKSCTFQPSLAFWAGQRPFFGQLATCGKAFLAGAFFR
jgi:hypothetical protein